jgi:hypothetical protein
MGHRASIKRRHLVPEHSTEGNYSITTTAAAAMMMMITIKMTKVYGKK